MDKKVRVIIVVFFGVFGVHKFIDKEYKMGILYLFTCGLFGIGWIIDIIKEITKNTNIESNNVSLMNSETLNIINNGELPNIIVSNINILDNEVCHYVDSGYTFKDEVVTTGYTGKSGSVSVRIMKGVSYRTGGTMGRAIKETNRTTYKGILCITNKRVIYTSTNECFDKIFNKITSITELEDGLLLQIGSKSYSIIVATHSEFIKVFNIVKEMNKKI